MTEKEHNDYVAKRCEAYFEESKILNAAQLEVSGRFDKWVISLPVGALGLSLLFYERIASEAPDPPFVLLGIAWLLFAAAIGAGLVSLYLSPEAWHRQIEILDADHRQFLATTTIENPTGEIDSHAASNPKTTWVGRMNWGATSLCLGGIVFLALFAFQSANQIPNKTNHEKSENPNPTHDPASERSPATGK